MTQDDVLFGYRLQLFDLAQRTTVSHACRTFGVHRSTYHRWKHQVERQGLEMLRPRERRCLQMPNQTPQIVEERIVAFSLGHPGLGPRRVAAQLARPEWGGLIVSPNGVWKVLRRHGINTRAKRLGLIAGYRAPYEPPREPETEPHITTTRPGELVGIDCFFVGRLSETQGAVWQITAIDTYPATHGSISCALPQPASKPSTRSRSRDASRASSQQPAGTSNACSPTTATSSAPPGSPRRSPHSTLPTRIRAGRPQTDGHVERLHRTILEECWRPAFARFHFPGYTGLARHLNAYITYRAHTGRIAAGRTPAEIVSVPTRWNRDEPHLSAQLGVCSG